MRRKGRRTIFARFDKLAWNIKVILLRFRYRRYAVSSDDRLWLEYHLLYAVFRTCPLPHILFIGVHPFTAWYHRLFPKETFTTMDSDPAQTPHGSPNNHVVASATQLAQHFPRNSFDVVICNGVYGWGLDSDGDVRAFASGLEAVLKPQGLFILGFNAPADPLNIIGASATVFEHFARTNFCDTDIKEFSNYRNHKFIFFQKHAYRAVGLSVPGGGRIP